MAKKDPTDLTVEEKLETLYKLQTTLSAIDEKRALRGELPLEVQDLEDEIAGLTTRVEKIKDEIEDFQQAVTQKKAEIAAAQISVKKYNEQLDDVQNNREYDTLKKEIEFQTLEIELCNKKIREAATKVEERKSDLKRAEEQIDDRKQALEEGKPEKIVERMVEGRINKFYKEVCLNEQIFVKDSDKTVKDILGDVKVTAFTRYQLGEGIEKKQENFAAEVAAQMK